MGSVGPGSIAYYVDDFSDEIMPCDATLEGWAEWLSKPDPDWPHDIPADGVEYAASALRFTDDIVATRREGGEWTFSRGLDAAPDLLAVRFGPGMGWDPDNILWWTEGATYEEALREFLSDPDNGADDVEHVAVGYSEPPFTLVYRANPPRLIPKQAQ